MAPLQTMVPPRSTTGVTPTITTPLTAVTDTPWEAAVDTPLCQGLGEAAKGMMRTLAVITLTATFL